MEIALCVRGYYDHFMGISKMDAQISTGNVLLL